MGGVPLSLVELRIARPDLDSEEALRRCLRGCPTRASVAVAVVDTFVADLAVFGVAEGVGLRGHERVGERLDHRAQQIGTRRSEVVLGEGVQGQTVGCGHRADLLRGFDTSKTSRWPFNYAGTIPMPEQTPGRSNPYTISLDATEQRRSLQTGSITGRASGGATAGGLR
jgi:hypothetical protein